MSDAMVRRVLDTYDASYPPEILGGGEPVTPVLAAVDPTTVVADDMDALLTIAGSGFPPGAVVKLDDATVPSLRYTAGLIQAMFKGVDIGVGAYALTVRTPDQTLISNEIPFEITDAPAPTITSTEPTSYGASVGAIQMDVIGTGMWHGTVGVVDGTDSTETEWVSPTQVRPTVPALPAGDHTVAVRNPDGKTSNSMTFTVTAAAEDET